MKKVTEERLQEITAMYPQRQSAVLPVMQVVQQENNAHFSSDGLQQVQAVMEMSASRVFGIASYYSMINTRPVGKYHLQVDTCVPGFLHGADEIVSHLSRVLGIPVGETTPDGLFTLSTVQDLASSATGPVIQVNDCYYENMTIPKTDELIQSLRLGQLPKNTPSMRVVSNCGILLNDRTQADCRSLTLYKEKGGYQALAKAMQMPPAVVVDEVKSAQLRGRGGAGFSAGLKWSFLPKDDPRPVYLLCNADEGEPGTFKDRQIMEFNPHLLVEGIAISAYAIGAKQAFIYIRGEFGWIAGILKDAIAEAQQDGQLGHVNIIVHRGAGSYVCGDETALIESLEGKRGNPRPKPPFPATHGLYGCPTVVNNVETLALVPFILQHGAQAFKQIGVPNNYGPRIFGVSGHVNHPGVFEYPLGTPLETILNAAGGVKGTLKGVIVGGLSVAILTAEEARSLTLDYDACQKAGTSLGSAGIIVINDTVSIPELALRTIEFYHHESCGQCVPCREGSRVIENKIRALVEGRGTFNDIEVVLQLCQTIPGLTICPTGEAFSIPVRAMITKFRLEFEALIR